MIIISPESLAIINDRLRDKYGKLDDLSYFRVVWSENQYEKRWTEYTKDGFRLLQSEIRELPKYKQWVQEKYILEGLTVVPQIVENELIEPLSYESIWVFEDKLGNALIPKWEAIHFILENLKHNQESKGQTKYKDPDSNPEEALERTKQRILDLEVSLYGNETSTTDALAYHGAITVPSSYNQSGDKK